MISQLEPWEFDMHAAERMVIYGALLVLVGANLTTLLPDRPAAAIGPDAPAGRIGPADAVSLTGTDSELLVRNRDGRLSWDDNAHARAYSIAFVHIGRALGLLLESERFVEEREELETTITDRDRDLTEQAQAMQSQPGFNPNTPDARRLAAELERWSIERQQLLGKLGAAQVEACYREFVEAVEVVADERKIDLVLRFIPTADPFGAQITPQAYTSIRGRTAVRYPEALDITPAVLEELDLE